MTGFPRSVRLTRPGEFQRVFQRGKRVYVRGFGARVASNDGQHARLGMAIAKKALKRAHDRNRVRRLIRESFRQHLDRLPPADVVLMCRPEVLHLSNAEIFQQLEGLWLRLHRLYSAGVVKANGAALP